VSLVGGMALFGPKGVVVTVIVSGVLGVSVFLLIPGLQMELIELGRRCRVRRKHLLVTCLLGVAGGFFIGGWSFLTTTYSVSADEVKASYYFNEQRAAYSVYNTSLLKATNKMNRTAPPDAGEGADLDIQPTTWALSYGAGATALTAVLRQCFAGFWFHPIGIVLGPSRMFREVWGSALVAFIIRLLVLKLGGARTVRTKLVPFFVGVFVAAVSAPLLFWMINATIYFINPATPRLGGIIF